MAFRRVWAPGHASHCIFFGEKKPKKDAVPIVSASMRVEKATKFA
ncbi:hypothetical protein ACVWYG_003869, partial [Pedobacter sp. UYEF25]